MLSCSLGCAFGLPQPSHSPHTALSCYPQRSNSRGGGSNRPLHGRSARVGLYRPRAGLQEPACPGAGLTEQRDCQSRPAPPTPPCPVCCASVLLVCTRMCASGCVCVCVWCCCGQVRPRIPQASAHPRSAWPPRPGRGRTEPNTAAHRPGPAPATGRGAPGRCPGRRPAGGGAVQRW